MNWVGAQANLPNRARLRQEGRFDGLAGAASGKDLNGLFRAG